MSQTSDKIQALLAKHKLGNSSNVAEKAARDKATLLASKKSSVVIDDILDELSLELDSSANYANSGDTSFLDGDAEATVPITIIELEEGETDPRLKLLSHSSRTTLHKCPRKFQLHRLKSQQISLVKEKEEEQGVTFAYGHAVGTGVASALENPLDLDKVILETFLAWDTELLDENVKQNKSYWLAQFAVEKFYGMLANGFLNDYELVYYQGKPAIELSFCITMPNGFYYRGFLDAVLKHKETGEIMVLENKTSSGTANSAYFKNSGQAVGYSVVLDILFPELSSYIVLYLVYETKSYDYVELPFKKSLLQRALWLQELLIDTQNVGTFEKFGSYPMHGESCFDFFRECEYLSLCTLSTARIAKPLTQKILDDIDIDIASYQFQVDFYDLVQAQISKGE
jgi:hypothetical protein